MDKSKLISNKYPHVYSNDKINAFKRNIVIPYINERYRFPTIAVITQRDQKIYDSDQELADEVIDALISDRRPLTAAHLEYYLFAGIRIHFDADGIFGLLREKSENNNLIWMIYNDHDIYYHIEAFDNKYGHDPDLFEVINTSTNIEEEILDIFKLLQHHYHDENWDMLRSVRALRAGTPLETLL